MDRRQNPYTPNAGAKPPALIGREEELENFEILLDRVRAGRTEQSMIITGLRGVGKTVLLSVFRDSAIDRDWVVVEMEVSKHDDDDFRRVLARGIRKALFEIAPKARWAARAKRAAATLRSFTVTIDPDGRLSAGLDVDALEGLADSGALDADLTDVFVTLGEAAAEHDQGVVLLLDEIQFLTRPQLEALISAIHKTVQRQLPVTLAAAGLPQIAELAGEAKSYAERLFKFPTIGKLTNDQARLALTTPADELDVAFSDGALDEALDFTEGYPYFLQEFGQAVWNFADGPEITRDDSTTARSIVEEKLDSSFFRVRRDRTTALELAYLRAMAELGPEPQLAASVAELLDRTSQQCGPTRSKLIEKGLLYTPDHGYAAFTVPQFDRYLKRDIKELVVPPVKKRKKRKK